MTERVVDDGLQGERTSLAWERTAMTFALVGALLIRAGTLGVPAVQLVGFTTIGLAGGGFLLARSRYLRRDRSLRGAGAPPGHPALLFTGLLAVVVSLSALGAVLSLAVRGTAGG